MFSYNGLWKCWFFTILNTMKDTVPEDCSATKNTATLGFSCPHYPEERTKGSFSLKTLFSISCVPTYWSLCLNLNLMTVVFDTNFYFGPLIGQNTNIHIDNWMNSHFLKCIKILYKCQYIKVDVVHLLPCSILWQFLQQ